MAGKAEGGTSCARCAGERISIHLHSSLASEVGMEWEQRRQTVKAEKCGARLPSGFENSLHDVNATQRNLAPHLWA